jgi:hypothetical protein
MPWGRSWNCKIVQAVTHSSTFLTRGPDRFDIAVSNQMGCPPKFPLLRPFEARRNFAHFIEGSGDPWPGLSAIKDINPELHSILVQISNLTFYIDMYVAQMPSLRGKWLTQRLILERNEIQYRLLSLPTTILPESSFEPQSHSYQKPADNVTVALVELTRLAALVYSDMILFPTAYVTGLKHRLAARMHGVAKASQMFDLGITVGAMMGISTAGLRSEHAHLLVWILWMGCFAAYRSELQGWFEEQLGMLVAIVHGTQNMDSGAGGDKVGFIELREALSLFLWYGPIFDEPGKMLWDRVGSPGWDSGYGSSPDHQ